MSPGNRLMGHYSLCNRVGHTQNLEKKLKAKKGKWKKDDFALLRLQHTVLSLLLEKQGALQNMYLIDII